MEENGTALAEGKSVPGKRIYVDWPYSARRRSSKPHGYSLKSRAVSGHQWTRAPAQAFDCHHGALKRPRPRALVRSLGRTIVAERQGSDGRGLGTVLVTLSLFPLVFQVTHESRFLRKL